MNRIIFLLGFFAISCTFEGISGEILKLKLSAKNLPDKDPMGFPSDPQARVHIAKTFFDPYVNIGETDKIQDNNNPNWPNIFAVDYDPAGEQYVKVDIIDRDFDADDYIGFVEIILGEIAKSSGQFSQDIGPGNTNGQLIFHKV